MKHITVSVISLLMLLSLASYSHETEDTAMAPEKNITSEVMTKETQQALTPQAVLDDFMAGNKRFRENELTRRNLPAQVSSTANGQYPKAIILSCVDSRVPVEMVLDQGIGDVFVARVAGNAESEGLLGSIEYAVGVAGSKMVMVMGHESCGAVKAAVDRLDVGSSNVAHLLSQIEKAIEVQEGERDSNNEEYLTKVIQSHVVLTVEDIKKRSQIVKQMADEGKIKVVGAYYGLQDGKVSILSE